MRIPTVLASLLMAANASGSMPAACQPPRESGRGVESIINAVSADNLEATIEKLVSFGTRHTLSETDSDERGIGAARRWLRDELQKIADDSGRDELIPQRIGF